MGAGCAGVACISDALCWVAPFLLISQLGQCQLQCCQLISYALICFSIFDSLYSAVLLTTSFPDQDSGAGMCEKGALGEVRGGAGRGEGGTASRQEGTVELEN